VVSGLVQRFGSLDFVSDNAGVFGSTPFPRGGSFISFGSHEVYVAVSAVQVYPEVVHIAADPPALRAARSQRTAGTVRSVEVMMTAPAAGKGVAGTQEPEKQARTRGPPMEREENLVSLAGTSAAPGGVAGLQATIDNLSTPVVGTADVVLTTAQLEEHRRVMLEEAKELEKIRREFDIENREFNIAHGFEAPRHVRLEELRGRGKTLNAEIEREGRPAVSAVPRVAPRSTYDTPVKNMRAARAALDECATLTGDMLRKQQARAAELLAEAERQNAALAKANSRPGASQMIHSVARAGSKSGAQASSPHKSKAREGSVSSGNRNKQMTAYDPAIAGKQAAGQQNAAQRSQRASQGNPSAGQGYAGYDAGNRQQQQPQRSQQQGAGGACLLPVRISSISSSKTLRHVAQGHKVLIGTTMATPH